MRWRDCNYNFVGHIGVDKINSIFTTKIVNCQLLIVSTVGQAVKVKIQTNSHTTKILGYGGKFMKTKISRIGKQSLSVILAIMMIFSTMFVGVITASAVDIGGSGVKLYYVDTDEWGAVNMYYWGNNWNNSVDLSPITNTKIYVTSFDSKWTNLTGYKFRSDTSWTHQSSGDIKTAFTSNSWGYGSSTSISTTMSQVNGTAKVVTKLSNGSGSYTETASTDCVAKVSGYTLNSGNTSATAVNSRTGSSSTAQISAAYGSTITYSASSGSRYVFKGFSETNSSTLPSGVKTSMTQTAVGYNGTSNPVVYAYFEKQEVPLADSVTLTASPTTVGMGETVTLKAALVNKAADLSGNIKFSFSEANGCSINPSAITSTSDNATTYFTPTEPGPYTVKVVASADGYKSVEATVNITVTTSAKPSVKLTGTTLTEAQMEVGKDIKLTAAVTPAKDSAGENVKGEYTVVFYKGATELGSNKVNVTETSTTVTSTYNTKLDELPATYTAKAYPTNDDTNISDASNEVKYIQKYPNKIYFDPSNMANWREFIQKEEHEFPTVTMTIDDSSLSAADKTYSMHIDPGFQFAKDKGVFVTKISDKAFEAIKKSTTKITFKLSDPNSDETLDADQWGHKTEAYGNAYIKDGSIFTFDYSGASGGLAKKWSDYNVIFDSSFPKGCTTYKEFAEYLATNTTKDVVYFDNSATQWYDVYIFTWGDSTSAFGTETVKMKRLKNFSNIWYYELPAGKTVPKGNFLFKDRSNSYGTNGSNGDAIFGYDYQQSVDLTDTAVIRAKNADDADMYFEDMKFDITKTVNKYKDSNGNDTDVLHNPIFITAQYANVTVKTNKEHAQGENAKTVYKNAVDNADDKEFENTEIKNRAFAYGWNDLWGNVVSTTVKRAPVTIYFDLHEKAIGNSTMAIYHSVRNAYNYGSLPPKTTLRRLGNSTIYAATIQLPYNEESSRLAFTFDYFEVAGKKYPMGDKAQPAFKCINTGEVWYEINSKFGPEYAVNNLNTKSTAKSVDSAEVGAQADSDSVGAETPNTTLLVPTNLKIGSSIVERAYVWYTDNGNHEPLGTWNDSLFSNKKYQTVIIDGKEFYYIPFYCSATKFKVKFSSGSNSNSTQELEKDSGKVYKNNQTEIGNNGGIEFNEYTGTIPGVNSNFYFEQYYSDKSNYSQMTKKDDGSFTIETNFAHGNNFRITNATTGENDPNHSVSRYKINNSKGITTYLTIDSNTGLSQNGVSGYADIQLTGVDTTKTYIVKYVPGTSNELDGQITISLKSAPVTAPSITLNPKSTNLTLNLGSVTVDLNPTVLNANGAKITYTINPNDTSKSHIAGDIFTADAVGDYVVTASITVSGKTYSDTVIINVSEPAPITDVCGILAYEHATAEFSSATGGKIDNGSSLPHVMLTNGYYSPDAYKTGYTVIDGDKYITIYGLADSVKKDASATFNASTSKADASSSYQLAGWKKNGLTMSDFAGKSIMTDKLPAFASTVTYLANWSEVKNVLWTFTYNWNRFDRSAGTWEFKWDKDTNGAWSYDKDIQTGTNAYTSGKYEIKVNLPENYEDYQIMEAYYSYAPTVDDDYFGYSFDSVTADAINKDVPTKPKVVGTATMSDPKVYKTTVTLSSGLAPTVSEGYYQSALDISDEMAVVADNQILVWYNETDDGTQKVLGTGKTLKLRVTNQDFKIVSKVVDKTEYKAEPYTTVAEPTYEAYVSDSGQNRVRMNFRVDNYAFGNNVTEYGILYFFCAENGRPLDNLISQDYNISADKLIAAVKGQENGITCRTVDAAYVNKEKKYFYQPTIALTDANKKRYLRMFSYFKYTDDKGVEQIVISDPNSIVIGSLSKFTPVF